jgi:hypothetical protein
MGTMYIIEKAIALLEIIPEAEMLTPSSEIIYFSGKKEIDAKESYLDLNGKGGVDNKCDENDNNDEEADNTNLMELMHQIILILHNQLVGISIYRLCVQNNTSQTMTRNCHVKDSVLRKS